MRNLTPHSIRVCNPDANGTVLVTVPPSGQIARVSTHTLENGSVLANGQPVPVFTVKTGEVTGLPNEQTPDCPYCRQIGGVGQFDTICSEHGKANGYAETYLVSLAVRLAVPDRRDVFSPGELIRDGNGQPVGCIGLAGN